MRIILVRPNVNIRWMIIPPLGLGYISAAAKQAGHEAIIQDSWLKNETPMEAAFRVSLDKPDIIGVQMFADSVIWTREFIKKARKYTSAKIIVGGPYVTALGDIAREEIGADVGIVGEFDTDLDRVIPMIMETKNPTIHKVSWFTDVNAIPIPDWDSMNLPEYWPYMYNVAVPVRGKRPIVIQRTRGCPNHCTFCASGLMGHKVRFRDTDNVIAEIEYLRSRWNIDEVWFQDDNAIVDYLLGWELFNRLAPLKLHIRLPSGIRWENVTEEMAACMKRAGVYYTGIGIESGNPRILTRIKKSLNQERAKEAIHILGQHGIQTNGFFIIGLPTETREEIEDTVQWAMGTRLHHAQFGLFIPYPGSEDYHECSLLPESELVKIQRNMTLRFYLRPRIIWNFIRHFRWSQLRAIWRHPWCKAWRRSK